MTISYKESSKNLWQIIFQWRGSIWSAVLPYCILNCAILACVAILRQYHIQIAFSPSGHGLMTLIISFLVISKVTLSYNRYMECRNDIGHALACLRECNQLVITYTEVDQSDDARKWRKQAKEQIIDVLDCTIRVIKDNRQAAHLCGFEQPSSSSSLSSDDDPMLLAQQLRSHIYNGSIILQKHMEPIELMKMIDMLNEYIIHYRNLLKLCSTPLPFPLVQMGRTFLFIWTFSIPFVLLEGLITDLVAAMQFVFFLTYGFIGMELVSMKMLYPFGQGVHSLDIIAMRDATVLGIERDSMLYGKRSSLWYKSGQMKRFQKSNNNSATSQSTFSSASAHHAHHEGVVLTTTTTTTTEEDVEGAIIEHGYRVLVDTE